MADSDTRNESDLDNWFDEPDTSGAWEERSSRAVRSRQVEGDVDDWVEPVPAREPRQRRPIRPALRRRWLAGAAVLVVCLLGGLAAAGVFSAGHEAAPPTTPSRSPTRTTTPTTTQTSPAPSAPATQLKPGDTGASVKLLQRALAHLGFTPGKVDGQYGPSTEKAVASFQRANGLTPDGVMGPKTLAALQRALASS